MEDSLGAFAESLNEAWTKNGAGSEANERASECMYEQTAGTGYRDLGAMEERARARKTGGEEDFY